MNFANIRFCIVAALVLFIIAWARAQVPGGHAAPLSPLVGERRFAPVTGRAIYREPFALVGGFAKSFVQVEQPGAMIDVDGVPLTITGGGRWQFNGANWAIPAALVRVSRNAAGNGINGSLIERADFTGFTTMAHVINDGAEVSTIRASGFNQKKPDGACLMFTNQDRPQLADLTDRTKATNSGHTIEASWFAVDGACTATGPARGACIRLRGEVTDMTITGSWFGGNAAAIVLVNLPDESWTNPDGTRGGRDNCPKRIRVVDCQAESAASKLIICYGVPIDAVQLVGTSAGCFRVVDGNELDNPGGGPADGPGDGTTENPPQPPSGLPVGIPSPEWGMDVRTDAPPNRTFSGGAFPYAANAGDVIEVAAGNYPAGAGSGYMQLEARGTRERPVIVRGVGMPRLGQKLYLRNSGYVYITGFDATKIDIGENCDHWVIADCRIGEGPKLEWINNAPTFAPRKGGGLAIAAPDTRPTTHGFVIRCQIVDNGDFALGEAAETHGITINGAVSNVTVLDCELARNSGDGMQINGGAMDYSGPEPRCKLNNIRVGRVDAHDNRQVGVALKQCSDVILSGVKSHGHRPYGPSPSAWGAGFGAQYGPARVWMINCESYDNVSGVSGGSSNGPGGSWHFVNFYAHDNSRAWAGTPSDANGWIASGVAGKITHPRLQAPGDSWGPAGMAIAGSPDVTVIGATLRNNDAGLNFPGGQRVQILGSIIDGLQQPEGNAAFIYDTQYLRDFAFVGNAIAPGSERFQRVGQRAGLAAWLTAFGSAARTGGNAVATGGTWTPTAADRAVFDEFKRRYGLDIDVDFSGAARPATRKIGAVEQ